MKTPPTTREASDTNSGGDSRRASEDGGSVRDDVLDAILEVAPDLERDELDSGVDLRSEAGLDSIDLLNIASVISEKTGVEIPEADLPSLHTVSELIGFIERHHGETP